MAKRSLEIVQELKSCVSDAPRRQALQDEWDALKARIDDNTCGRRLDVEITASDGDVAWVDVAGQHPTSAAYLPANDRFVRKLAAAEACIGEAAHALDGQSSPGVQARVNQKKTKYQVLDTVADLQVKAGTRVGMPGFFACVITHLGEFSADCFRLIGWLAGKLKASVVGGLLRRDGLTAAAAAGRFVTRMKSSLMCAVVSGFGQMLASGGFVGHRLCPS
jgi:hypothetical protein